jgi:hypothetical protein
MQRHAMRASGPLTPLTLDDARRLIYLDHYNTVRLRGAIDYVTPQGSARRTTGRATRLAIASWNRLVASANFAGSRRCLRGLRGFATQLQ